ncbi:hypothetical protein U1Q18_017233, partial [Sarracenia purpurea var. burkii]
TTFAKHEPVEGHEPVDLREARTSPRVLLEVAIWGRRPSRSTNQSKGTNQSTFAKHEPVLGF